MPPQRAPAKAPQRPRRPRAQRLPLAGEIRLEQLGSVKKRLNSVLACTGPVTLDVTRLKRLDTPGLQLLAAFVRERQASGRAVMWQGTPAWLAASSRQLGLAAALALT